MHNLLFTVFGDKFCFPLRNTDFIMYLGMKYVFKWNHLKHFPIHCSVKLLKIQMLTQSSDILKSRLRLNWSSCVPPWSAATGRTCLMWLRMFSQLSNPRVLTHICDLIHIQHKSRSFQSVRLLDSGATQKYLWTILSLLPINKVQDCHDGCTRICYNIYKQTEINDNSKVNNNFL